MSKKMKEFEKKTHTELRKLVAEKREQLREFRFGMKGSRTRNTKEGAQLKKDIARIMTHLGSTKETVETK